MRGWFRIAKPEATYFSTPRIPAISSHGCTGVNWEATINNDKDKTRTPPPMDDEEFDAWRSSFGDVNLDEFEREIEKSISGYEILPDPDWDEFAKTLTPSDDGPQSQPDLASTADDDA